MDANTIKQYIFRFAPVFLAQVLSKGSAAFKDVLIAFYIGLNSYTDTYFMYLAIPGYLVTVFAGPLQSILVPAFTGEKTFLDPRSLSLKLALFGAKTLVLICGLGLGLFLLELISLYAFVCLVVMSLILPLAMFSSTYLSSFSAYNRSLAIGGLSAVGPLASFLICFALLKAGGSYWALPISFFFGYVAEFLFIQVYRFIYKLDLSALSGFDLKMKAAYKSLVVAAVFFGSASLIDSLMINYFLTEKSMSFFSFGLKLVAVCSGMGALMVNLILFPDLSKAFFSKDKKNLLLKAYKFHMTFILLSSAFGLAALYAFGGSLLDFLFLRGKSTSEDLLGIAHVFYYALWQIPFFLMGVYAAKGLNLFYKQGLILKVSIVALFLNVGLNYFLLNRMGVAGVALSTVLVYVFTFLALNFYFLKSVWGLNDEA